MKWFKTLRFDQKGVIFSVGVIITGWGLTAMDSGIEAVKAAADARQAEKRRAASEAWETEEESRLNAQFAALTDQQFRAEVVKILTDGQAERRGGFVRVVGGGERGVEVRSTLKMQLKPGAGTDAQGQCQIIYTAEIDTVSRGGPLDEDGDRGYATASRTSDVGMPCYQAVGQLAAPRQIWVSPENFSSVHVSGTWWGNFRCDVVEGEEEGYKVKLDLVGQPNGSVAGTATVQHAYNNRTYRPPDPVPIGKFSVAGTYDRAAWTLTLQGTGWSERPEGYQIVSLRGEVRQDTRTGISGEVFDAEGRSCGGWTVHRDDFSSYWNPKP